MVLIDSVKYACATCIKGHRSSTCNHDTRPLIEIKKKGRPVTQCVHCRELRKTKQVHVKCLCEGRPDAAASAPRTVLPAAAVAAVLTAAQTAHQSQTLESANASGATTPDEPTCNCKSTGGSCACCTPKHVPRQSAEARKPPPTIARGHTYHAPPPTKSSTDGSNNGAIVATGPSGQPTTRSRHTASLQRSATVHGHASASHSHSSHSRMAGEAPSHNPDGSHHPHPNHHHSARHFAPYQVSHGHHPHHNNHAHFDLPEEVPTTSPLSADPLDGTSNVFVLPQSPRRARSSSVSHGSSAFPTMTPLTSTSSGPATGGMSSPSGNGTVYMNGGPASMSLPDLLAWNGNDLQVNPMPSFQQGNQQQSQYTSSSSEFDEYGYGSADEFYLSQFGASTAGSQVYDEPLPEFRFDSEPGELGDAFRSSSFVPSGPEYEAAMASLLSFPNNTLPAGNGTDFVDGPRTGGSESSGPPSMTGSVTTLSRSSSRASGGFPTGLEMTSAIPKSEEDRDRGRVPRPSPTSASSASAGFPPISDPFENEAAITTAIPSSVKYQYEYDYDFASAQFPSSTGNVAAYQLLEASSEARPHSHSPMSQDGSASVSGSSSGDDGSGTQFPPWPSSGAVEAAFDFTTPAGAAALVYPKSEFEDPNVGMWRP